jgi:hypothetical protein
VGKTYLIRQHFKGQIHFDFVGSNKESTNTQIANFNRAFEEQCTDLYHQASDWSQAFHNLARYIKEEKNTEEKVIVFFDEFPWMDKQKSGFLAAFEYFWNQHGNQLQNLLFIICGSVSSWIIKNILKNYGGLHNRVTQSISIQPFDLQETEEFIKSKNLKFTRTQIAELYMTLGGIPYYLDMIPEGSSVAQVIYTLFFRKNSPLRLEFNNLYASLFKNPENYIVVIKVLADHHYGLTLTDLVSKSGLVSGGSSHRVVRHLEEGGFIKKLNFYGKKNRESMYRLVDFFSLFYLRFVQKMYDNQIQNWHQTQDDASYKTWCGYAYENLYLLHITQLYNAMGIRDIKSTVSSWKIAANEKTEGTQIDLIIDRKDGIIHLCEVKYNENPLIISKDFARSLAKKRAIFSFYNPSRKAVVTSLLTLNECFKNEYFRQDVYSSIDLEDLMGR